MDSRLWKVTCLLSVFIGVPLRFLPGPLAAQEQEYEVVANLATGRVVIYVAKDGIVIGAVESRSEADAHPPIVVPLSRQRAAILLGATEWVQVASGRDPVRLDLELPKLLGQVAGPKRLEAEQAGDLEQIGVALLEPLRAAAGRLHRNVGLAEEEPLLELILVGYVEEYGPEVWSLRYRAVQEPLRGDYWRTRVLRPSYNQLYPPEKGQPRTLIEARYPPDDPAPTLADLLEKNDPRLARLRTADAQTARAAERLVKGESHKALLADATALVRAALGVTTPADAAQAIAVISEQSGFEWILAPPGPVQKAEEEQPRAPGAPSLRKKP